MELLDHDLETGGKTWLNPRRLDVQIACSQYRGAAFVISGRDLVATTGPVMEHIELLSQAWLIHGESRFSRDTPIFSSSEFDRCRIGLLRGNAGITAAAIQFDVPKRTRIVKTSEVGPRPVIDTSRLDIVLDYIRAHAAFRTALPGIPVLIRLRNYVDAIGHGGWLYDGLRLRTYESEMTYLQELGQT